MGGYNMSSTFGGLEIGKRALQTQQRSLEVAGHNVANANNENYSRQRAIQSATVAYPCPGLHNSTGAGQVGTGVEIATIERVRDEFTDQQLRYENHALGKWSIKKDNLKYVETIFNELEQGGLVNTMDEFWASFGELSDNPESMAVREAVVQRSITLVEQFKHFDKGLTEFRDELGSEIKGKVIEFNDLTQKVANLNNQIQAVETNGKKNANDLMDERDALLDKLSKIADISYKIDSDNQANISLNGTSVVQGKYQNELVCSTTGHNVDSEDSVTYANFEYYQFEVNGNQTQINSGEIGGFLEMRGDDKLKNGEAGGIIDYKINKLDKLARQVMEQVNDQHQLGRGLRDDTARDFFTGNDASDIDIISDITGDPGHIAAASSFIDDNGDGKNDYAGDNTNSLKISSLRDKGTIDGTDFNDFWQREASMLGIEIEQAERMEDNQQVLVDNLKQKKQELSGVSLDEEMSEMIKFQHGYNAAAKIIAKLDERYNTLINGILR